MAKGILEQMTIAEITAFGKRMITEVIDARGFGVISKGEIEALMFDEISRFSAFENNSNYTLATKLRITERKVKSLQLTADLRYGKLDHTTAVRDVLERVFRLGEIKSLEQRIQVPIENPAVLRQVEQALKRNGETPEYGRNREILIVTPEVLVRITCDYLSEKQAEEQYLSWLKQVVKDKKLIKELNKKAIPFKQRVLNALQSATPAIIKAALSEGVKLGIKATTGI